MNLFQQLAIARQLFLRECVAFSQSWKNMMIDNVIIATMFSLVFGYFMPAMGMPLHLRMPMFLGAVIVFCISVSNMVALNCVFDITGPKVIAYHLTLPTRIGVVISAFVAGAMVRSLLTIIPVLLLGITIIGDWGALDPSYAKIMLIIPLVAFFWVLLFMTLSFLLRKETMLGDIWPRIIMPMFVFGCVFYPWAAIARHAPQTARWMLFNPMTHSVESIRSAFLPAVNYVPFALSVSFLSICCGLLCFALARVVRQRLNLVEYGKAYNE